MELEKMSHQNLVKWIQNLDFEISCDSVNKPLFLKWKKDAENELKGRNERREHYLKWKSQR